MTSSENTKLIAPPLNIGGFDFHYLLKMLCYRYNHNTAYVMTWWIGRLMSLLQQLTKMDM